MAKTTILFSGKISPFKTRFGGAIPAPKSFDARYRSYLNILVKSMVDVGEDVFLAIQNGESKAIIDARMDEAFGRLQVDFSQSNDDEAKAFVDRLDTHVKRKASTMVKQVLGVPKVSIDFASSKMISDRLNFMIARNITLIHKIGTTYFGRLDNLVSQNFSGRLDLSKGSLGKQIHVLSGVSRRHATLIARDQTSKVTGNLVQMRHEQLGIISYKWRNSDDSRVVGNPTGKYPKATKLHGNHWAREGKTFYYRRPPSDGNPGQPIQCRCHAEPIIRIEDLELKAA